MKGVFTRTIGGLRPADDAAEKILAKQPIGRDVLVDVSRPRSLPQMRLYWSVLALVWENLPERVQAAFPSVEVFEDYLCIRVGHAHLINSKAGLVPVPKSVSFAKADQDQFNDVLEKIINLVCGEIIPGLNKRDLMAEVNQRLGVPDLSVKGTGEK